MESVLVRPMTQDDLAALEPLVAGRNVHRREYERFLGLEGAHGLVLEVEGRVVAAVTAMRQFEHGIVGPVLTAPEAEGVGVVLVLLARAVDELRRAGVARIEAEAGETEALVLAGMGFARVRGTIVMEREPGASRASEATRAMEARDLLDVGALDAQVAGYGRKAFLAAVAEDHPDEARVAEVEGEPRGYALMRRSRRGWHLGPLVTAEDDASLAEALLQDALARAEARPVVALLPEGGGLEHALARAGFARVGALSRMRAGGEPEAPGSAREWLLGSRLTG